jgi:acetyltransferase
VVVKLRSHTITHKTDVGGVKLGLPDAAAVSRAFREIEAAVASHAGAGHFLGVTVQPMIDRRAGHEVILGSAPDTQFGPVLLFGAGGELVEVFRDRALALPPLNRTLARRMMEQTRIYRALQGVRGRPPADLEALESLLVRFGDLVLEQRWIREIDVNPLLVTPQGALALDARVVLHDTAADETALPRPAIRPYPTEYVWRTKQRDDQPLLVRPIRPDDEASMVAFHRTLSEESVRARYLQTMKLDDRTAHERLVRICFVDYDRELALVAEGPGGDAGAGGASPGVIMAVGRLSHDRVAARGGRRAAEFSLLVGDPWQGRGLGRELLGRLIDVARHERLSSIYADILGANVRMQRLCTHYGFRLSQADGGVMHAALPL